MTASTKKKLLMRRVDLADSETNQDGLIQQACSDRAAFARLYRMHYEKVFRYRCRRLFNRHDAEEVTSTVFFKIMRTISTLEGNSDGFRNWLYRIATNAVNDRLKTAKKRAEAIRNAAEHQGRSHAFAGARVGKRKAAVPSPCSMRVMTRRLPGSMYSVSPARSRGEDAMPSSTTCTSPTETSTRLSPSGVTVAVKAVPISTNFEVGVSRVNPFDSGVAATNRTCPSIRNALLSVSGSRIVGPNASTLAPLLNCTWADPDDSSVRCPTRPLYRVLGS